MSHWPSDGYHGGSAKKEWTSVTVSVDCIFCTIAWSDVDHLTGVLDPSSAKGLHADQVATWR